jgi:hypothetical protein
MSARKVPSNKSDKTDATRRAGRPTARKRHNETDMPVMDTPITDRKRLFDLKHWVVELHEKQSYRWIAAHTWRGDKAFGYFQSIAAGEHLTPNPRIRPRVQDWHDLNLLRRTVRDFTDADSTLFDAALQVVEARAQLDLSVANMLALARKRTGEKVADAR